MLYYFIDFIDYYQVPNLKESEHFALNLTYSTKVNAVNRKRMAYQER